MAERGIRARLYSELRAARRHRSLTQAADRLRGAVALEPGGLSALFGRLGLVPVYSRLAALDTLDFAERTLWSGTDDAGIEPRRRIIGEAARLEGVADRSYDAVLASHVLEHLADPLGALSEWKRVVRPGGHILLVVPHRDGTFDHRRPVTTLEHLRQDARLRMGEDDRSHVPEIIALHDLERDPSAPNRDVFEQRCRDNPSTRAVHHHVFITRTVAETCREAGLLPLLLRAELPFNIVCLCRVDAGADKRAVDVDEPQLLECLRASPFASDRRDAPARRS